MATRAEEEREERRRLAARTDARIERAKAVAEAERAGIFTIRGGQTEEVPPVGALEGLASGIAGRGEQFAAAIMRLFADDPDELARINERAFRAYARRSEARLQQPAMSMVGNVAPDLALVAAGGNLPKQAMGAALSGFTQPAQSVEEQFRNAAWESGLAMVGNRIGTALGAQRAPGAGARLPIAQEMSQRSRELLDDLQSTGYRLAPHEVSDSRMLRAINMGLEAVPFGSGATAARERFNRMLFANRLRRAVGLDEVSSPNASLTRDDLVAAGDAAQDRLADAAQQLTPLEGLPRQYGRRLDAMETAINRNRAIDASRPAESGLDSIQAMRDFLRSGDVTGLELAEQRRNFLQQLAEGNIGPAKREAFKGLVDIIDGLMARQSPNVRVLDAITRNREQLQVATIFGSVPNAIDEAGAVNPFSRSLLQEMRRSFGERVGTDTRISNPETAILWKQLQGMNLPNVVPFRSSGTAERNLAAQMVTGGALSGGGFAAGATGMLTGEPVADAMLLGLALPGGIARAYNNPRLAALFGPSGPFAGRAGAAAGAASQLQP